MENEKQILESLYGIEITPEMEAEILYKNSTDFVLGKYLYMGMGLCKDHRVVISVAYKIDYCIKKAIQFLEVDSNITFTHINKVRVGETVPCSQFIIKNKRGTF
jgi:hypothetical protein